MVMKKTLKSAEPRVQYGKATNRTSMSAAATAGPILGGESDQVAKRIREIVGEEPQRAFARRCGISEGSLRDYMRDENPKVPGLTAAAAIADAGGYMVDWLATGRLPKTRAELRAMQDAAKAAAPGAIDSVLLQEVMEFFARWVRDNATRVRIDQDRHAAVIAVLYKIAAKSGKVEKPELEQVLSLAA